MDIGKLTSIENQLFEEMPEHGYFEDRDKYLRERNLYEKWAQVFEQYALLAQAGNLEALKRGLFFAWYQMSEPSPLSGIPVLEDSKCKLVFEMVDEKCKNNNLDKELVWSLPYYFQICDYYFERFEPLAHLRLASEANAELWKKEIELSSFVNRGQLGKYWAGINV